MPTYILPNGNIITYTGDYTELERILNSAGISYTPSSDDLAELEARSNLAQEYQATKTILQSHIEETAWTNAKIINAIVFHARVLLVMLKILRRLIV